MDPAQFDEVYFVGVAVGPDVIEMRASRWMQHR